MAKKKFFDTTVGKILKTVASVVAPGLVRTLDGVSSIGEAVNLVRTSTEGTAEDRLNWEKILLDNASDFENEVTERWKADSMSDSWMSKNIRPLSFAFVNVVVFCLVMLDSFDFGFTVGEEWVTLYKQAYTTMIAGYIGVRGIEKSVSMWRK